MKKLMKKLRDTLNNERGLTLIELLAVVVILAIIAAIAIPSIGGLMDNTKKDAHVANAEQMISSARLAVTGNQELSTNTHYITLQFLYDEKYLEKIKDPDNGEYVAGPSLGTSKGKDGTDVTYDGQSAPTTGSYVKVVDGKITQVFLLNNGGKKTRAVGSSISAPLDLFETGDKAHNITRKDVKTAS